MEYDDLDVLANIRVQHGVQNRYQNVNGVFSQALKGVVPLSSISHFTFWLIRYEYEVIYFLIFFIYWYISNRPWFYV